MPCPASHPTRRSLIVARVLQGLSGGLINPQVSGLVQQMFQGRDRGRAFGVIGTVGRHSARRSARSSADCVIAMGGADFGWRLVFFINIPIGVAVIVMARRWLPDAPRDRAAHRSTSSARLLLGLATFCVLFAAVEYDAVRDTRLFLPRRAGVCCCS